MTDAKTKKAIRENFVMRIEDMLTDPKRTGGRALPARCFTIPAQIARGEKVECRDRAIVNAFIAACRDFRCINEDCEELGTETFTNW